MWDDESKGWKHLSAVAVQRWIFKIEDNSIIARAFCRLTFDELGNLLLVTPSEQKRMELSSNILARVQRLLCRGEHPAGDQQIQ
jgi:hypothetical protein